jgi:hypothetical protein
VTTYRIIPKRGTYKVEFVDPKGKRWVVGTWRTEEAAVSELRKLQGEANRASYRPAQGELAWQPPQPAPNTTRH